MNEDSAQKPTARQKFCRLASSEPFRAFFPIGMVLGIVGVALWPLFETGILKTYPLDSHIRLMSYGFLGSFVIGFLLTAGPRLLSCRQPTRAIVHFQLGLTLATAVSVFLHPTLSDLIFLFQILCLLFLVAYGFIKRQDLPPPGFILGLVGILSALLGSFFLLQVSLGHSGSSSYTLSRILLFQAFPALPIIGIGAFFFPKLTGSSNPQNFDENPKPTLPWLKRAAWALATALVFLATIPIELKGHPTIAYSIRAGILALYVWRETPVFKRSKSSNNQHTALALCSASLLASFVLVAIFPAYRTAALHLFFIVGLTGAILLVSTRVIYGHSGNFKLAKQSGKPLLAGLFLLSAAGLFRFFADFTPQFRTQELVAASILWMIVSLIWMRYVAPKAATPDPDDTPCTH